MAGRETAACICQHVFDDTRPVLLVSRADGDWQALCGAAHVDGEGPRLVGLNHLFERDPTLRDLADLPPEWEAERFEVGAPSRRSRQKGEAG